MVGDPSLIFNAKKKGPTTHAIVVGVGWYPHLPGGGGTKIRDPQGLTQLTSPIASARAFATWLLTPDGFKNGQRQLSTVRFLTSEKKPKPFFNPKTGESAPPAPATFQNLDAAIKAWYDDGNKEDANLLLFYFCGHGLGTESTMTLLPQDFGADPDNVLDTAFDFSTFVLGMKHCKAGSQAFFIDACRSPTDILRYSPKFAGRPIKSPNGVPPQKDQSVFWSTRAGANSQGVKNKPSYYTSTLLAALGGLGADLRTGTWQVSTGSLANAVKVEMNRRALSQAPPADPNELFVINDVIGNPKVPVSVICLPEELRPKVKLSCSVAAKVVEKQKKPAATPWVIELPALQEPYVFAAQGPDGPLVVQEPNAMVLPPGRAVNLKVVNKP